MYKIKILILLYFFILFQIHLLYSEEFLFKYSPNIRQRIEANIKGEQFVNQKKVLSYHQKYKTIREILAVKDGTGIIEDVFYFYNKNTLLTNQILELENEAHIIYKRDRQGNVVINEHEVFPTYRNIPKFPLKEIKKGEEWTFDGIEVQDLFNDGNVSLFPISVKHKFIGYEKINNIKCTKFEYKHELVIINNFSGKIDDRLLKINGTSVTVMYFDNNRGSRVKEEYKRHYSFLVNEGLSKSLIEFIDSGERTWFDIELMNKDKMVNELKKHLEKEKIKDAQVKRDSKGVKLSLENLHFYPDKSALLPEEKERFKKIAKILKNYKERGIMIIGHTTDKGTKKGRLKLSLERAKAIVDYLIDLGSINVLKSSFGGKGGSEPIADNTTEEGMKKNRRAEIYILEE